MTSAAHVPCMPNHSHARPILEHCDNCGCPIVRYHGRTLDVVRGQFCCFDKLSHACPAPEKTEKEEIEDLLALIEITGGVSEETIAAIKAKLATL